VILLAGPFPPEAVFVLVPLAGLLWGVLFCMLALPFRLFRRTSRPWVAVGIPALAVVCNTIYGGWGDAPWRYPVPTLYFSLEQWIRGLLVYVIGAFLAIWFYKRRDARNPET